MKRFDNAISKLVSAFLDGSLRAGDCTACAVGNICNGSADWSTVFLTTDKGEQKVNLKNYTYATTSDVIGNTRAGNTTARPRKVIKETGYSWEELARVEKTFENNTSIKAENYKKHTKEEIMEDQYKGLMAVVDVLSDIEGIEATETKKMFEYEHVL